MKKRILAFALTLAMVVGSLSMLSFVTFAEEPEPATENLYAWFATMNVDLAVDKDDPQTFMNQNLLSNLIMCVAWDYDNAYIQMYYHSQPQGAKGLINVDWTVGGAVAEDGTVKLNTYAYEAAIPLNLIAATVADGVISAPMTLTIEYNDDGSETNKTIEKEYNFIFSGRTMITRAWGVNKNNPETNGFTGFSPAAYDRGNSNLNVFANTLTTDKAGVVGGSVGNNDMVLFDNFTNAATDGNKDNSKVVVQATQSNLLEKVSPTLGASNHTDMVVTVNNLRPLASDLTANEDSATVTPANVNYFQLQSGGKVMGYGASYGARIALYTKMVDTEEHIFIIVSTGNSTISEAYDLTLNKGIKEGDAFHLGYNENADGTVDVLINEDKVLTGAYVPSSFVGNGGNMVFALKRTGKVTDNSDGANSLKVTVDQFTLSKINTVDVETVSAKFKTVNGDTPTDASAVIVDAKAFDFGNTGRVNLPLSVPTEEFINVGSLSKLWQVIWDTDNLYLALDNANVDKFNINVGGAEAEITYSKEADVFVEFANGVAKNNRTTMTLVANCTSTDGITATTHAKYNTNETQITEARGGHVTMVTIPLSAIDITETNTGIGVADISITATVTEKFEGRKAGTTVGNITGIINFNTTAVPTGLANLGDGYNITTGGGTTNYGYAKTTLDNVSYGSAQRGVVTNFGSLFKTSASARTTFDLTITNLAQCNSANIKAETHGVNAGLNQAANAFDRMLVGLTVQRDYDLTADDIPEDKLVEDGVHKAIAIFGIYNTEKGIVVSFTDLAGNVTLFETGITHTNGSDTVIDDFTFSFNADNSGCIYIGDELIGYVEDARSILTDDSAAYVFVSASLGLTFEFYHNDLTAQKMDLVMNNTKSYIGLFGYELHKVADKTETGASDATIKLAYVQESEVAENKYDVRLIATINSLDAKVAGFKVALNSNEVTRETDTVYKSILANVNGDIEQINAADGEYFVALTITGVPATGTYTFEVTPYFTYASETTYGTAYEVTYTDGVFVSCVAAAN